MSRDVATAGVAPPVIFEDGPFSRPLAWLTGGGHGEHALLRRAVILALVVWVPLVVLSLVQDGGRFGPATRTLLTDVGVYARFFVALPLVIVADYFCGSRLTLIARYFVDGGLVAEHERTRFSVLVASTRRLCASGWVAIAIIVCVAALLFSLYEILPREQIPRWHHLDDAGTLSAAGWWHVVVGGALLLGLLLGWLWRLLVWTRFLWRIAGSPLHLCAAHPDRAAGLKFVGYSVRAYAPIGCALGAMFAGRVANQVLQFGTPIASFQNAALTLIAVVLALCGAPLLVFANRLLLEWREGVETYGRLAQQLGITFERKWFREKHAVDASVLEASDFSAAVDLSGYATNVYDLRMTPGDLKSFVFLAGATVAPMVPVVVLTTPPDALLKILGGVLL